MLTIFHLFFHFQPDENTLMQFGLGAQNTINDVSSSKNSSSQNATPYRERGKITKGTATIPILNDN